MNPILKLMQDIAIHACGGAMSDASRKLPTFDRINLGNLILVNGCMVERMLIVTNSGSDREKPA
jgi:hypothetical protein